MLSNIFWKNWWISKDIRSFLLKFVLLPTMPALFRKIGHSVTQLCGARSWKMEVEKNGGICMAIRLTDTVDQNLKILKINEYWTKGNIISWLDICLPNWLQIFHFFSIFTYTWFGTLVLFILIFSIFCPIWICAYTFTIQIMYGRNGLKEMFFWNGIMWYMISE